MKNLSSENLCLYFVPLQMNNDDVVIVNKRLVLVTSVTYEFKKKANKQPLGK